MSSNPTISNFAYSSNPHINNSTINNTVNLHYASGNGFERLLKSVVPSAMHDAGEPFDRPKCNPNTRVAVLNRLKEWVVEPEKTFMWLYGDAGAGKSSIAQSLAEWSAHERCLLGSFFFSKNDVLRATPSSMVPTIAYHAAVVVPQLKPLLAAAVEGDPMVVTKELSTQITSLLVNPVSALAIQLGANIGSLPHLIIIDGLDECSDPRIQCRILQAFSDALRCLPRLVKVIFASRAETPICSAFNSAPLQTESARLALDDTYKPDDDIRYFLQSTFVAIKATHHLRDRIASDWPPERQLTQLVQTSSGQFIYASTVAKYVSASDDHPVERLEIVLGLRSNDPDRQLPFTELDVLYKHILMAIPRWKVNVAMRIFGLLILGKHMADRYRLSFNAAEDLSEFLSLGQGKLEVYLSELASIVGWKVDPFGTVCISISHASLSEYFLDHQRSHEFHLNLGMLFCDIIPTCVENLISQTEKTLEKNSDVLFQSLATLCEILPSVDLNQEVLESLDKLSLLSARRRIWSMQHGNSADSISQTSFFRFAMRIATTLRMRLTDHPLCTRYLEEMDQFLVLLVDEYQGNVGPLCMITLHDLPLLRGYTFDEDDYTSGPLYVWSSAEAIFSCGRDNPRYFKDLNELIFGWLDSNFAAELSEGFDPPSSPMEHATSKQTVLQFFNDARRSGKYSLTGDTYATASLCCVRYCCEYYDRHKKSDSSTHTIYHALLFLPHLLATSGMSPELVAHLRNGIFHRECAHIQADVEFEDDVELQAKLLMVLQSCDEYLIRVDPLTPHEINCEPHTEAESRKVDSSMDEIWWSDWIQEEDSEMTETQVF